MVFMRKLLIAVGFLPLLGFAMGSRAVPETLVPAKVIDKSGVEHEVKALVCDDKTYFEFKSGSVTLKVPFTKIKTLKVVGKKGDELLVEVVFKDNRKRELLIDPDVECVGPTDEGTLDFYLEQVEEIDFLSG